jgi:DNA modification methylase
MPRVKVTNEKKSTRSRSIPPPEIPDIINSPIEGTTAAIWVSVDKLVPWVKNPRKNEKAVEHAIASIKEFGWGAPLIARQENGEIIGGHTRIKAALKLGIKRVPVRYMTLNEMKAHALAIADNRVGEFSSWDEPLRDEVMLEFKDDAPIFEATGFKLENYYPDDNGNTEGETVIEVSRALLKKWGTKSGQTWEIPSVSKAGNVHRIHIGDSTNEADIACLFNGKRADFLFTSPPYNVGIQYESHDDSEVPWAEYRDFLRRVLEPWIARLEKNRLVGWNIGVSPKTQPARQHLLLEECGLEYFRQMVWRKTGVPLPIWQNTMKQQTARAFTPNYQHEVVYLFSKGSIEKGSKIEVDELLQNDVFDLSPATLDIPRGRGETKGGPNTGLKKGSRPVHPAVFPVRLPLAFIRNLSDVDGIIGEPFCGSGTTIIASELAMRCGYGMEIDPMYAASALERLQKRGLSPKLSAS